MLAETGSSELIHWFAYLEHRDRHERLQMTRAIGVAIGGQEEEPLTVSDDLNPLGLPPPPR